MFRFAFTLRLTLAGLAFVCSPRLQAAGPQVSVHDPSMLQVGGAYYLYSTGPGVPFYRSTDWVHWVPEGRVFPEVPSWVEAEVPHFYGHLWAPDVVSRDGRYYLYYAVSGFGKNRSAIGLAINEQIDPSAPGYKWIDQGVVVRSVPGRDLWNAIDPNVTEDQDGHWWLAFGSFWGGLHLVKLADDGRSLAEPEEWHVIVRGDRPVFLSDNDPGPAQIEAPYIFRHRDYYYLFFSAGLCCRGKDSTYHLQVGRSRDIRGPYLDKNGVDLAKGGGTVFLAGNPEWAGLGHNCVLSTGGKDYLVFHAYETADHGLQKLKIAELSWGLDDWPIADAGALRAYRSELLLKP